MKLPETGDGGWIDISRPVRSSTPVWPGDRPYQLHQRRVAGLVVGSYETTCHIGTHLDAPLHLDSGSPAVESVPVGRCVGPAEVVGIDRADTALTPARLPAGWEPHTSRVLLRTDTYPIDGDIGPGYAGLTADLVHWLADRGVGLVGIDTPSVDLFESDDLPAHHALAERGLIWIEGLWLGDADPGSYFLAAQPVLLEGAEAAPVRAILHPLRD